MANVKISQLSSAASLTGSEEIPVVQSGATVKTTAQAIADLGGGGGLGTLDINVIGGVIGNPSLQTYFYANVPEQGGSLNVPIESAPNINISIGGGYGGSSNFTATGVEFPTLTTSVDFAISGSSTLQTLSAPLLTKAVGNVNFTGDTQLTSINLPSLVSVSGYVTFGNNPSLTNAGVNFASLETTQGLQLSTNNVGITGFTQAMFPVLEKVGIFNYGYNSLPAFEINLPTVTDLSNGFQGGSSSSINLTNVNLPGLVNINSYISLSNITALSSVRLGTPGVTKSWGNSTSSYANCYLQSCSLDQASVDNILTVLASLDGTNGTTLSTNGSIYLSGGVNSAPSSTGLAAISVLQSRGFYVTTN